jgi:hypothetical protein
MIGSHAKIQVVHVLGFLLVLMTATAVLPQTAEAGPVAKGAAVGAAGGAVIGGIAGGKPLKGAAVGAAVGAVVGKIHKETR